MPWPGWAGGDCVEVADNLAGVIGVRDAKDPAGPALAFDRAAWTRFVAMAKSSEKIAPILQFRSST
ncbi:DUF397 domain-containing protein [Micromonospora sp. NBC_00330]|uniref:DUF397 domain-containing protein n=1 Tax=Micromonospora sp. NBC_00330 TaxID=2903585 RepID=UPI002E29A609|nr:DUF397 domain-containing protein [Micromonospora sp. NBC_00330]